jgi:pyruvate/2-oxoglutarate dehydrogenase complex dihydrolipoamide dehydrogenase (E3) component
MASYDAIVIGSGQGGNPLAYKLADLGWRVALIEREQVGGTCVNTGCTPTKTMVSCAQIAYYARNAPRWGVHPGAVSINLAEVVARKRQIVTQWRAGVEKHISERANLRLVHGHARFVAAHRVSVNGEELESEHIFVDTGTRPVIPPIKGLDQVPYLDNATIMELTELPPHLLVLGGGYIGLEFGQMFARFGSRVTVIEQDNQILAREDPEIVAELQKALEAEGIEFLTGAKLAAVEREAAGLALRLEGRSEPVRGSHLLMATGRRPNTDDLGLERAGVQTDPRGFIRVNGRLETNVPGVWALGDCNGGPAFTHISYNDYQIIYGNLIESKQLSTVGRVVPYAVFTDPELGRVGITEREARSVGRRLKIGKLPLSSVARAIERDETAGLMKLVVDADNDRILGAAILAAAGGELVHVIETVMLAGAPYTLLKGAVYIHPTLAEGFWSLMETVAPAD